MWQPTISPDELYHHGILGMKWGKKNGPPYPLGAGDHSASEKKAGWHKSLSDNQKAKIKTAAKITTGVLLGAAVVGGTIYLAKTGKLDDVIKSGKDIVDRFKNKPVDDLPEVLGAKRNLVESVNNSSANKAKELYGELKGNHTPVNDMKTISQHYNGKNNCGPASICLLQRVNDNIDMVPKSIGPTNWPVIEKIFPDFNSKDFPDGDVHKIGIADNIDDLKDRISLHIKQGESGLMGFVAKNSGTTDNHYVTIFNQDNKIIFRDATAPGGLEFSSDGNVTFNGVTRHAPEVIQKYLDKFNLDVSTFGNLSGKEITSDENVLNMYFKKGSI